MKAWSHWREARVDQGADPHPFEVSPGLCGVTRQDLAGQFGPNVVRLVAEVSVDQTLSWAERRKVALDHAKHYSPEAGALKLADMTANAIDLRLQPPGWKPEKIRAYRTWILDMLAAMPTPNKRLARLLRAQVAESDSVT